jgi:hypothetical protein
VKAWLVRALAVLMSVVCLNLASSGQTTSPACVLPGAAQQGSLTSNMAVADLARQVRVASFSELARVHFQIQEFHSPNDYFRTRFSVSRFLFLLPMRYSVQVNPRLFTEQAPIPGVCAILAHELVHVATLSHGNRIRRFAIVRLVSGAYTARFERQADIEAIHRGYGAGLKTYRNWVYTHIAPGKVAEKKQRYFSPEEIDAIEQRLREYPEMLTYWRKHVPLNLDDVRKDPQ